MRGCVQRLWLDYKINGLLFSSFIVSEHRHILCNLLNISFTYDRCRHGSVSVKPANMQSTHSMSVWHAHVLVFVSFWLCHTFLSSLIIRIYPYFQTWVTGLGNCMVCAGTCKFTIQYFKVISLVRPKK